MIFDKLCRGIKAEDGKPKVETLDLVCCNETVSTLASSSPYSSLISCLQIRDRWFDAIDQLIESMKEVRKVFTQSQSKLVVVGAIHP